MNRKQSPSFFIVFSVLVVLALSAILYSYYEEKSKDVSDPILQEENDKASLGTISSGTQITLAQDYEALLGMFSVENPGSGVLDYPGNISADYAKSYAMFLSAELLRAQREPDFLLSERATNAGYWLLDNSDNDADGVIGWGLPVAWDAYGDGTVNPPDTIYTITTAIAINGLLDWLEMDPYAPSERIIATVDAAFQPFLDPGMMTPNGLFPFSFSAYDQGYDTFNPAAYMAGQMQRFSDVVSETEKRDQLRVVADQVMKSLLENKRLDQNQGWYWNYSVTENVPNDAAHAIYIIDGISHYIKHQGTLADQFDWESIARHIDLFYSLEEQEWRRFPQLLTKSYPDIPRLYEMGMLMHFMGMTGRQEEGASLYFFSRNYRLPDGTYAKFPIGSEGEEDILVVNEYMSYLLYGWSALLNGSSTMYAPLTASDLDVLYLATFPITEISETIIVPFTFFDVEDYAIDLEFNVSLLAGNLIVNQERIALPSRTLPLKIIEWDKRHLIVFTRALWTNQIQVWTLDLERGNFQQISIPNTLNESMFRQAVLYNKHVVFILFDPIAKTNYLYRLLPTYESGLPVRFDENFEQEYYINEIYGYRQQPKILTTEFQGRLYICSDSVIYDYHYFPLSGQATAINTHEIPNHYRVLELASSEDGIFALYKDSDYSIDEPISEQNTPFILYDIYNLTFVYQDYQGRVPYHLHVLDGQPETAFVETLQDIDDLFLLDLQQMPASGMMSAGVNNYEGEVIWTQSYYLNAIIDILGGNDDFRTNAPFNSIKPQLKRRLDFEMALIDKMMLEGPGLSCKTFTVDRSPVLHAVQTGKFLLLMKRYLTLPNAMELKSYKEFRQQVINLDKHIEILVQADSDDPWLPGGRHYLMWPKGAPFWADGVGIPYNHQNMWAAGVLFGENRKELPEDIRQAVFDISSQVLDFEGFRAPIPKNSYWYANSSGYYEWFYWWGQAKEGWTEAELVSTNTPSWIGDGNNVALPVYRTFDAISILIAGKHFYNFLPTGVLEYFREGVENGKLELFLIPYLEQYGKTPNVSQELAVKYLRLASQPDLRNAVWSYSYLYYGLSHPASLTELQTWSKIPAVIYLLDVLFVLLCSLLLNAILGINKLIPWLLGLYLFGYTLIVLTVEVGGMISLLNSKVFFLVFHSLFLLILTGVWLFKNSPNLFLPVQNMGHNKIIWLGSFRSNWDVWLTALICVVGYFFLGYSNFVLPQKIDDVLTAHLARLGYWLQYGNLDPWPADTYQMSQIIYPLNAQAQVYWSLLFLRTDQLAGFSQWVTVPVVLLNIYGLCRMMQVNQKWSVVAALVVFSLPNIYLQSLSAMTDLVSAALFISMIYLFFSGLEASRVEILGLSGLAFGLSLGTKQTIIFAIPSVIIVLLFIVVIRKGLVTKSLLQWAGASIGAFILTGAYIYISNFYWWGSPLGPPTTYQGFTQRETTISTLTLLVRFWENLRSLLQVIFRVDLFSWNYGGNAWPGPVFGLIFIFAIVYIVYLVRSRQKNLVAFSLFVIAFFYALALLFIRDFTGALSRYLIITVMLLIPLGVAGIELAIQIFDKNFDVES